MRGWGVGGGGWGVGEGWHKNIIELYGGGGQLLYINTHHCIPTS